MTEKNQKNKILDWMERRLKTSEDFHIPLKKLRRELETGLTIPIPPPEKLKAWLEEDSRFDLIEVPENLGGYPPENEAEMEKLGFFQGPRIGLKNRRPSPEQILEMLQKHTARLVESLQKAYDSRPREGEEADEIEDQLLELLQRAQKIKEELPAIGENPEKK